MNKTIKKLICTVISAAALVASLSACAEDYYDASKEVNQIESFMNQGLYLEVMRDCENTIAWHKLSPEDIEIFQNYSAEASKRYNEYINYINSFYNAYNEMEQIRSFINRGMYVEAMQCAEDTLNGHRLSSEDITTLRDLYNDANRKYNEYLTRPKIYSPQMAIEAVRAIRSSSTDDYLGIRYEAYDRDGYFLVRAITTRNANGEARYNVVKSTGRVDYLGEGSDW